MHFLVIDDRFGTPIYVFLEHNPHGRADYPELPVREIAWEALAPAPYSQRCSIGCDPNHLERFREFASDGAVTRAGFILIEPRYVGTSWENYSHQFRPEGMKVTKHPTGRGRVQRAM